MRAIGVLGGTFDPVHFAHLRLGYEVAEHFALSEVRFIPAGQPPHRAAPKAAAAHRVRMVELAIAGNPLFKVDLREVRRPRPSYTYDSLSELRAEFGASMPLALVIGSDQVALLHTWHRWQELFELGHIIVAHRPGYSLTEAVPAELRLVLAERYCATGALLPQSPAGKIFAFEMTPLDMSATRIRAGIAAGVSPRYLLPDSVLDYIRTHKLYLQE